MLNSVTSLLSEHSQDVKLNLQYSFFFPLYLTKKYSNKYSLFRVFSLPKKHLTYENLMEISMELGTRGNGILAALARSCSFSDPILFLYLFPLLSSMWGSQAKSSASDC